MTRPVLLTIAAFALWSAPDGLAALTSGGRSAPQATSAESAAQGRFGTGLEFLRQGQYDAALTDFEAVARDYAMSTVADNALLEIARIKFFYHGDVDGARGALNEVKKLTGRDGVPSAHILESRINVTLSRTPAEVMAALKDLDLIRARFPDSRAVFPEADLNAADVQRLEGTEAALARYQKLILNHSNSTWAANAYLGAAQCLVRLRRAEEAIGALQRLRDRFPTSISAETAKRWNTIIFRLYLRGGDQYRKLAESTYPKTSEISSIGITPDGAVVFMVETGANWIAGSARQRQGIARADRALHVDRFGRIVAAAKNWFSEERGQPAQVVLPKPAAKPQAEAQILEDISAIAVTSLREVLVGDKDKSAIFLVPLHGRNAAVWMEGRADRLLVDDDDNVAVLNRGQNTVQVYGRDKRRRFVVASGSKEGELKDPRDIAFDALGHLYVLDRNRGAVLVYGADGKHVTSVSVPDDPNAFKKATAIAVDGAGRILAYDERTKQIQAYQ